MSDASPRFRQDLSVSPSEAEGVACVDVRDPTTGVSFQLYDFEYQLALQLNGQPVEQVTGWASKTYGAELTTDGIREFAGRLGELGFLEPTAPEAPSSPPVSTSTAVTREVPAATPAAPAPAGDSPESSAEEWQSSQGAATAQFVPDPSMLDSAPELTPVVAPELAGLLAVHENVPAAVTLEVTAPAIAELPREALGSGPSPAVTTALPISLPTSAKGDWAVALDGDLQSTDSPAAVAPVRPAQPDIALPLLPSQTAVEPPPGVLERRQPPGPEAVVMSGFSAAPGHDRGPKRRSRAPVAIVAILLLAALGAVGYWAWSRQHDAPAGQALRVRVMSPAPTAAYRWFAGRGQVTDYETTTLAFATPGRLAELLPAGTEVAAGDVVGELQGAAGIKPLLEHDRSRVGFYKQLRDSMHAAGNAAEEHQAELHLAEKTKLVDMAVAALAKYTIVAAEPGVVVETLAKIGAPILPGVPVVRLKGRLLHGAFALDAEERATLAKLTFCRIEVVGLGPRAARAADSSPLGGQVGRRMFDCQLPARQRGDKMEIPLPADLGLVSGQPLRLARERFDGVFPVPSGALVSDGDRRSLWLADQDGRAELRPVIVADVGNDALVTKGLHVGEQIIVDPPAGLQTGAAVLPARSAHPVRSVLP